MQRYADIDHDSGVKGFDIEETSITIYFKNTSRPYIYSYRGAGMQHVQTMKKLALAGDGLNEYINDHVRKSYD